MSVADSGSRFSVLFICTANICRSPALEMLLRARGIDDVAVSSLGTRGAHGLPVDPPIRDLLVGRGISGDGFRSRPMEPRLVGAADLILTATRAHRSIVARSAPAAMRRMFTAREFIRLASASPNGCALPSADGRREFVADLARTRQPAPTPDDDNIEDPFGRSGRTYRRQFELIASTVDSLAFVLTLGPAGQPHP